jgi:hypothetical protein
MKVAALAVHCGIPDAFAHADVTSGLPVDWVHVTLDLDVDAGTAKATLDRQQPVMLPLGPVQLPAGTPELAAGILFASGLGPEIGLDDIVVTLGP